MKQALRNYLQDVGLGFRMIFDTRTRRVTPEELAETFYNLYPPCRVYLTDDKPIPFSELDASHRDLLIHTFKEILHAD